MLKSASSTDARASTAGSTPTAAAVGRLFDVLDAAHTSRRPAAPVAAALARGPLRGRLGRRRARAVRPLEPIGAFTPTAPPPAGRRLTRRGRVGQPVALDRARSRCARCRFERSASSERGLSICRWTGAGARWVRRCAEQRAAWHGVAVPSLTRDPRDRTECSGASRRCRSREVGREPIGEALGAGPPRTRRDHAGRTGDAGGWRYERLCIARARRRRAPARGATCDQRAALPAERRGKPRRRPRDRPQGRPDGTAASIIGRSSRRHHATDEEKHAEICSHRSGWRDGLRESDASARTTRATACCTSRTTRVATSAGTSAGARWPPRRGRQEARRRRPGGARLRNPLRGRAPRAPRQARRHRDRARPGRRRSPGRFPRAKTSPISSPIPRHPPIFNDETDLEAKRDYFGGLKAQAGRGMRARAGQRGHYALGRGTRRADVRPGDALAPGNGRADGDPRTGPSETVLATCLTIIRRPRTRRPPRRARARPPSTSSWATSTWRPPSSSEWRRGALGRCAPGDRRSQAPRSSAKTGSASSSPPTSAQARSGSQEWREGLTCDRPGGTSDLAHRSSSATKRRRSGLRSCERMTMERRTARSRSGHRRMSSSAMPRPRSGPGSSSPKSARGRIRSRATPEKHWPPSRIAGARLHLRSASVRCAASTSPARNLISRCGPHRDNLSPEGGSGRRSR